MRIAQEKVELFMTKIGDVVNDKPTLVDAGTSFRRYKLILEELQEYNEASSKGDLVGVADALGDLLYTVLGLACLHGLDSQSIFEEVHRSNMTKDVLTSEEKAAGNFKLCRKGPTFSPARIADVLLVQSTGLGELVQ